MIRQWQELFYENRLSGADLEGNPDFVKLAEAYGVKAWRIKRAADVDRVLQRRPRTTTRGRASWWPRS